MKLRTKSWIADAVGLVAFITMVVAIDAPSNSPRYWAFFALGLIMRAAGFFEGVFRVLWKLNEKE